MTDHQQAAIEAAAKAMADDWNPDRDPILTAMFRDHADSALAAAEPHLRKKWAAEVREKVNPPDVDYSHEWRRGFTVCAIKAARFVEGAGE